MVKNDIERFLNRMGRILNSIETTFVWLGIILISISTLSVVYGVIGRFFKQNVAWTFDLNSYSLLFICFFAAPWVVKLNGHVSIDLFTSKLSGKKKRNYSVFIYALSSVLFLYLLFFSAYVTWDFYLRDVKLTASFMIPQFTFLLIIPLGSLLMVCEFFRQSARLMRGSLS